MHCKLFKIILFQNKRVILSFFCFYSVLHHAVNYLFIYYYVRNHFYSHVYIDFQKTKKLENNIKK